MWAQTRLTSPGNFSATAVPPERETALAEQVVERQVGGHAIQPGLKTATPLPLVGALPHAQESLLEQVLGGGLVAYHTLQVAANLPLIVMIHEFFQGMRLAHRDTFDELLVPGHAIPGSLSAVG